MCTPHPILLGLMAYSKAKLKNIGVKASPCFKPFLIGNMSDKFLLTRTLLARV